MSSVTPSSSPVSPLQQPRMWLWCLAFLAVAFNLRAPFLVVGPLVDTLMQSLQMTPTMISVLTTIPVVCFACISPIAPQLAARLGLERAIALALSSLVLGVLVRLEGGLPALLLGTVLIGAGIACGNVFMPTFIKGRWPNRIGLMMGWYSVTMGLGSTLSTATAVPLKNASGGMAAPFTFWAVLCVVAWLIWMLALRFAGSRVGASPGRSALRAVMRSPLAWALTLFMGCQSLNFYTLQAWLSPLLVSQGASHEEAGIFLSMVNFVSIPSGFLIPQIATRFRSQSLMMLAASAVIGMGMLGIVLWLQQGFWLWSALIGFGQGATLSLAFVCMIMRAKEVQHSALLSGMSQSFGYALAALGPMLFGILHEWSAGWLVPMLMMFGFLLIQAIGGMISGQARHVEVR